MGWVIGPPPVPPNPLFTSTTSLTLYTRKRNVGITSVRNEVWAGEGLLYAIAGEALTFSVQFNGLTLVSASAKVYADGNDVTATVMPAGSVTVSSDTSTLKPLTALTGSINYVVAVTAVTATDTRLLKFQVNVFAAYDNKVSEDTSVQKSLVVVAGESVTPTLTWQGAGVLSTPTCAIYLNGVDTSSTNLSGSNSVSGNVQTLKTLGSLIGGNVYILTATCVVDGNTEMRKILLYAVDAKAEF